MSLALKEQVFSASKLDLKELKSAYDRVGFVVLRKLLPPAFIDNLLSALYQLISTRLTSLGKKEIPADIDLAFALLIQDNPRLAMDIIRASKDLPEYYQSFTEPSLLDIAKVLVPAKVLQCVHDISQFRIDPQEDLTRNFGWHQDFQYNVASLNSVTAWFPLRSVTTEMGCLNVVPESHHKILPVRFDMGSHRADQGTFHSTMRLDVDEQQFEKSALELTGIEPGDVVFFSCLLVHRSGINRAQNRARWVMNPRYGDALDQNVAERGWVTNRDKYPDAFQRFYPEYSRTVS